MGVPSVKAAGRRWGWSIQATVLEPRTLPHHSEQHGSPRSLFDVTRIPNSEVKEGQQSGLLSNYLPPSLLT